MKRRLKLYQLLAGASDTITGLLLVVAPLDTLRLMRVNLQVTQPEFISYIGILVLGVGVSYLWVALRWRLTAATALAWKAHWETTAIIRLLVALFVIFEVATGAMEPAWASVAAFDALIAAVQITGILRGWLDHLG